jgi:hypothetical protein
MSGESPGACLQEVVDLIERKLGIPRRRLTTGTSLYHDCGVAGVDGEEFMKSFARSSMSTWDRSALWSTLGPSCRLIRSQ